jgi:hypothetical protein|tara:strand:+ start:1475 stop:1576 length:102 start_codon:yes stop_codon:yes gene_type:complete
MLALEEKPHPDWGLVFYEQDGVLETALSFSPLF